jgi:signal peptidase I
MKAKKWISRTVTIILSITLALMIIAVISSKASGGEPKIFGYQLKTVLSGSMEPTFKTGSIIAVKPVEDPTKLKEKDVITFKDSQDVLVTHRIVEVIENDGQTMFRTQGDNVDKPDSEAVLPQNVVAKYTGFTLPFVGYFLDFAKSKNGTAILTIIPGLLLLIYAGFSVFKALKEIDNASKSKEVKETV